MAILNIQLSKIKYNAKVLQAICEAKQIMFVPVIKCIAGDAVIVEALKDLGIYHFAESRLDNIQRINDSDLTYTLLRAPRHADISAMVKQVETSIQTELITIDKINEAAESLGRKHKVMLMIDWKDGREGVLTYDALKYIEHIMTLKHIHFIGVAFNFMCFKSDEPSDEDIIMINKFVAAIEREIGYRLKIISGGNSSMIPQLMYNDLGKINQLRIGESLFRGIDTTTEQSIAMLYQDAITLEAEIIEIKPRIDSISNKAYLQAIVDVGYLDTIIQKISPLNHDIKILGASSDHLMLDLNNQDYYQVGDKIQFSLQYEALSQTMYMKNLTKQYNSDPLLETLVEHFHTASPTMVKQ